MEAPVFKQEQQGVYVDTQVVSPLSVPWEVPAESKALVPAGGPMSPAVVERGRGAVAPVGRNERPMADMAGAKETPISRGGAETSKQKAQVSTSFFPGAAQKEVPQTPASPAASEAKQQGLSSDARPFEIPGLESMFNPVSVRRPDATPTQNCQQEARDTEPGFLGGLFQGGGAETVYTQADLARMGAGNTQECSDPITTFFETPPMAGLCALGEIEMAVFKALFGKKKRKPKRTTTSAPGLISDFGEKTSPVSEPETQGKQMEKPNNDAMKKAAQK